MRLTSRVAWARGACLGLVFCCACSLPDVKVARDAGLSRPPQVDAGELDAAQGGKAGNTAGSNPTSGADANEAAVAGGGGQAGEPPPAEPSVCKRVNGGCDPLTQCEDEGGRTSCGPCPPGYLGTGETRCTPTLIALGVSTGVLSAPINPDVSDYTLYVPIATQSVQLTATLPDGAIVRIDRASVASGDSWTVPLSSERSVVVPFDVTQPKQPTRGYSVTITRGWQQAYIKRDTLMMYDRFGDVVAIDRDTAVVGSPRTFPGAALVFIRNGDTWRQQAALVTSSSSQNFGTSVAIDGDTIVVGSDDMAHVFVRRGTEWTEQAQLVVPEGENVDEFGRSSAISGNTVVVGARSGVNYPLSMPGSYPTIGKAYVFERSGTTWNPPQVLRASNEDERDRFGHSVAVSGGLIAVGATKESSAATGANNSMPGGADNSAPESGAVYVFSRDGMSWTQEAYLKASNAEAGDLFGSSVALSGDTLVVGAMGEAGGAVGVNNKDPGEQDNSAAKSGAGYVFVKASQGWKQEAYLKSDFKEQNASLGWSVAISGNTIILGKDPGAGGQLENDTFVGSANVFTRVQGAWHPMYTWRSEIPGDAFGRSVAVSGDTFVIGAPRDGSRFGGICDTVEDWRSAAQEQIPDVSYGAVYIGR